MRCALCDGKLVEAKGEIEFKSRALGKVIVPSLAYSECTSCGDKLLPPEMSDKAIDYIEKKENEAIDLLPIGQFVTANEAAEILGISKQAFSKNPRIKRGMIYSKTFQDRRYYDRKSVELFKESRNGKYRLPTAYLVLGIYNGKKFSMVPKVETKKVANVYSNVKEYYKGANLFHYKGKDSSGFSPFVNASQSTRLAKTKLAWKIPTDKVLKGYING